MDTQFWDELYRSRDQVFSGAPNGLTHRRAVVSPDVVRPCRLEPLPPPSRRWAGGITVC